MSCFVVAAIFLYELLTQYPCEENMGGNQSAPSSGRQSQRVVMERLTPRAFSATADSEEKCIELLQRQVQQKVRPEQVTLLHASTAPPYESFVNIYGDAPRARGASISEDERTWLLGVDKTFFAVTVERNVIAQTHTASVSIRTSSFI